jgi:multidrug transporter EmrE-like cation transporter
VGLFLFITLTQILAISLIPRTAAFTDPYWTIACLSVYLVSLWTLSYMIHTGMQLSLLIPILSAIVPLATIAIGVIFYKEAASLYKVVLLCAACGMIGVASSMK